ncbi:MAG: hypothetical protein J6W39_08985 [Spirochaetales bacterium]|nr:hypothetical protein [Spirochaetales bacterium]
MVKTSKSRKSVLLTFSIFAFVALLLISCSADSLMNAGEKMGKLSSGGLGKAGSTVVTNAAESVANFAEGYDRCFKSRDTLFFAANDAKAGKPTYSIDSFGQFFFLKNGLDGSKELVKEVKTVSNDILKAIETGRPDAEIKKALAMK